MHVFCWLLKCLIFFEQILAFRYNNVIQVHDPGVMFYLGSSAHLGKVNTSDSTKSLKSSLQELPTEKDVASAEVRYEMVIVNFLFVYKMPMIFYTSLIYDKIKYYCLCIYLCI